MKERVSEWGDKTKEGERGDINEEGGRKKRIKRRMEVVKIRHNKAKRKERRERLNERWCGF